MGWIYQVFDLFNSAAKKLAGYLPQSGEDVIQLFKQSVAAASNFNLWITDNIGINLQAALSAFGRLLVLWLTFLFDLVKNLVNRL